MLCGQDSRDLYCRLSCRRRHGGASILTLTRDIPSRDHPVPSLTHTPVPVPGPRRPPRRVSRSISSITSWWYAADTEAIWPQVTGDLPQHRLVLQQLIHGRISRRRLRLMLGRWFCRPLKTSCVSVSPRVGSVFLFSTRRAICRSTRHERPLFATCCAAGSRHRWRTLRSGHAGPF